MNKSPLESEGIDPGQPSGGAGAAGVSWSKLLSATVVLAMVVGAYFWLGDALSLETLARQEARLLSFKEQSPGGTAIIAAFVYALLTGFNFPGATGLSLFYAWYFKFFLGLIVVSFGSTAGATISFLLSRYWFRDWIQQRWGARVAGIQEAFDREGPLYLFTLRLIPAVPFFLINPVMGLTRIRVWTFWWVSQLGMLPATVVYVYAGSTFPSLQELADQGIGRVWNWQTILALVLIGTLPILIRAVVNWWRPLTASPEAGLETEGQYADGASPSEKR